MDPDEDLGFVADAEVPDPNVAPLPDDLGFEAAELHHETGRRRLVLPETTVQAGGPVTVAPGLPVEEREVAPAGDAIPAGMRESGRRMTVLPEMTIGASVNDRGRITDRWDATAPASTGYEAREVVPDPTFAKADRTRGEREPAALTPPSVTQRLARWALGRDLEAEDAARLALGGPVAVATDLDLPAFGEGAGDALAFGWADELQAGHEVAQRRIDAEGARDGLNHVSIGGFDTADVRTPATFLDAVFAAYEGGEEYEAARDRLRAESAAAQARAPGSYALGSVAGSASLAAVPGGAPTALGRMAVAGGLGLAGGMLRGAGESGSERLVGALDQPSVARDALRGGAVEGLLSAGTAGVGEAVGPLVSRIGEWAQRRGDEAARAAVQSRLEGTGVWGNRAMRAADEMPGGPEALAADMRRLGIGHGVGEPRRIARSQASGEPVDRTWLPRSTRTPDDTQQVMSEAGDRMRQVLDAMDEAASGRNAALLEGTREQAMRGMVDVSRVADEMDAIAREYEALPVGGQQIANAIRTQIVEPMRMWGVVRFSDAHRQRRLLDSMIRGWAQDPNLATAAGRLQTARRELSRAMDEAASRLSPELQAQWRQANRDYSVGAFADEHGQGASRLSVGGGMGGAMGTGVELATSGVPFASIPAAMANREAAQQTRMMWPGLRAVALEALAPRLRALGPRADRWAQALEAAERRGSTSLAAVHAMLQRRDPEYRRAIEDLEQAGETGEE